MVVLPYDLVILIQQISRQLVGAAAVGPPTVPAERAALHSEHKPKGARQPTSALPVFHGDGRLSIQLLSGETLLQQVNRLPLQTQPRAHVLIQIRFKPGEFI